MTERRVHHRFNSLWVLAPVTAGVLGLSADWAIQHNPLDSTEASTSTDSAGPGSEDRTRELQARLENVTARYEARREVLVDAQRSLRQGAHRLAVLSAAGQRSSSSGGGASAPAAQAPAAPVPQAPPAAVVPPAPPAAPPAPPPVDTSTGAS